MHKNKKLQSSARIAGMMFTVALMFSTSAMADTPAPFHVTDSSGKNVFSVTETGRVSIGGNLSPVSVLYTEGNSSQTSQIMSRLISTGQSAPGGNTIGGGGFVAYHNNFAGTLPVGGDRLGYYLVGSLDGSMPRNSAGMLAYADADWQSGTSFPTYLSFVTTDAAQLQRAERLRISAAGNIGIGTPAPATKLHVVKDTTQGGSIVFLDGYEGDGTTNNGPNLAVRHSRGTVDNPLPTKQGDIVGQMNFRGRGPSGFAPIRRAGMLAYAGEDYTDTAQGTMLRFATTPNGTATPVEQVVIDNAGNVGIGMNETSLTQKLEVNGGVRLVPQSSAQPSCNETTRGTIWVVNDDVNGDIVQVCLKVKSPTGADIWETVTLNRSN